MNFSYKSASPLRGLKLDIAEVCSLAAGKEFLIGMVLYKTKSLYGTKPNTNRNPNTNPIQLFYAFFRARPMIFKLASFVRFSQRFNKVLLPAAFNSKVIT